jgi:hypothetical protein
MLISNQVLREPAVLLLCSGKEELHFRPTSVSKAVDKKVGSPSMVVNLADTAIINSLIDASIEWRLVWVFIVNHLQGQRE